MAGFLLDNAGKLEQVVLVLDRQVGIPAFPGGFQLAIHGAHGQFEQLHIGRVLGVLVGIREEHAFRVAGAAQRFHQLFVAHALCVMAQGIGLAQRGAYLTDVPAFADAHLAHGKFALDQLVEEGARGIALLDFVGAGLEVARTASNAQPQVQQPGWRLHAGLDRIGADLLRAVPGLDLQVDQGLLQAQGLTAPPVAPCGGRQQEGHDDDDEFAHALSS